MLETFAVSNPYSIVQVCKTPAITTTHRNMGLIKSAIGQAKEAMAAKQPQNGFNGPNLPFTNKRSRTAIAQNDHDHSYNDSNTYTGGSSPPSYVQSQTSHAQGELRPNPEHGRRPYYHNVPIRTHDDQYTCFESADYDGIHDQRLTQRESAGVGDFQGHDMMPPQQRDFPPVILPQIGYGKGQPFLRGYSQVFRRRGISRTDFIHAIDAINVAIMPNPEAAIFQKGANIAGWFM